MKKQKHWIWVLFLVFVFLIWVVLQYFYPKTFEALYCGGLMLYCTYKVFYVLVMEEKLKKIACIEWWLYTVVLYIVLMNDKENTSVMMVSIALIIFSIRVLIVLYKLDDVKLSIGLLLGYVFMLFCVSLATIEIEELFWIFKVFTMIAIFSIIKIIGYTNRFNGMIILCISYVFMVLLNGILSSAFWFESARTIEERFYITIKNMYSLSDIDGMKLKNELWEHIINFMICRIADAVLIGCLVDIFNEKEIGWFEKRKK